jgi:DNA-binding HxlR family transcriptional regulator
MVQKKNEDQRGGCCPMDDILRLIMGPWTTYILWLLETDGELRFGELKARMPRISSKVLTERLRMLEGANLVHRDYEPTVPPTVTYSMTRRGHELKNVLKGMHTLALRWQAEGGGTEVEPTIPERSISRRAAS